MNASVQRTFVIFQYAIFAVTSWYCFSIDCKIFVVGLADDLAVIVVCVGNDGDRESLHLEIDTS